MANATTTHGDKSSQVRPRYIDLGTDACGAIHTYRTTDETVIVVQDGAREHVSLDDSPVEDWMEYTADRRGWGDQRYGGGLVAQLADALEGSA